MNNKFLLAAMAFPMLFAACSQDELIEGVSNDINVPEAKGYYMTLAPTLGDIADSRATWLDSNAKLVWDKTDLISVYWLDDQVATASAQLDGKFNSIFKTEDGSAFTSESMVFEGGNIAVYPGDLKFTNKGKLFVNIPLSQDASTITKTPYVSNYLNVTAPKEGQEDQLPGYNNGLYSPMKLAANVLYLNIELANIANLAQYNFKVDSVSLVTTTNKFADKAPIKFSAISPCDAGKVAVADGAMGGTKDGEADELKTITNSVFVSNLSPTAKELTATAVEDKGNGKYLAKFVVLPTQNEMSNFSENTEIVIYTNCGRINLTTTSKIGGAAPTNIADLPETPADNQVFAGVVTGQKNVAGQAVDQTIAELLSQVTASHIIDNENSNFNGERVGMAFARTIQADMKNATLNDSKVFNSDDIKNYVAIHTAMNSEKAMNLILSAREGDTFKSLTKEAIAAVDAKNDYKNSDVPVTLSVGTGMTAIEVVGGGAVYNAGKSFTGSADLALAAGAEWTMNDFVEWSQDNVSSIINNGTLTVAGTTKDGIQNSLNEILVNNGTLKIGGNNILQVADKLRNITKTVDDVEINGVINVAAGQDLVFDTNVTAGIAGVINVAKDAFITVAKDRTVVSEATINNNGTVSSIVGNGGWTNNGVIEMLNENAITYVQKNANGVINLYKRNNEVVVKDANQGKIVYNWNDGENFMFLTSDKYTYVVFDANKTSQITLPKRNDSAFKNNTAVSFEITGGTINLTVDKNSNKDLYDLKVAKGATLTLYSGNDLKVHCLINEGNITVGGTITWNNTFDNFGVVRSVGNGAILAPETTEETKLKSDLSSSNEASLSGDVRTNSTLNVDDGKVLNGNGYTLSVGKGSAEYLEGSELRFIEMNNGGTIRNLVIDGNNATYNDGSRTYGIRAMYLVGSGTYSIDNVIVKNVTYTINDDTAEKTLNVSNSTLEGWTSYNNLTTATFDNVKFEVGPTQGTFRPYGDTTLTNCSFEDGFVILLDKLSANNSSIDLDDCYYNGVKIATCEYVGEETVVTLVNGIVKKF